MPNSSAEATKGPLIVGVGASAGGLEAFRDLFARLADNDQLALILIQHLDPDHRSLLQELLSKRTSTPVNTAEDGMAVEAGNIYLIPPGSSLTVKDRTLHLQPFDSPRGQRRPIDTFFESLAEDAAEDAVAIVLSGTGSDGAEGIKSIKERGGLVIAQDPEEAAYDGMPRSAIATGAVDLTLTIAAMADVLEDYRERRSGLSPSLSNNHEFIARVFKHVRYHTGNDFSEYKHSTLLRRLAVRMSALGISGPADYIERLIQDRGEAIKLQRDLLINVTSFFRDSESFDALRRTIIPKLVEGKGRADEIRVWVPGCSTGEEAYGIAMLLAAEIQRTNTEPSVTVFGTDIDDEALAIARAGRYSNSAVAPVPPEFLSQFMIADANGYEANKRLRAMVRFSQQNLIKDPPFSKLDLVSCRNLLIYFDNSLQKRAMEVFHYALKPDRYLFLGLSENPQSLHDGFSELIATHHIYQRDSEPARPLNLPLGPLNPDHGGTLSSGRSGLPGNAGIEAVRAAIVERHSPPYIACRANGDVAHVSGGAERFVQVRAGEFASEITGLIHPALESVIRRLNNQSGEAEESVSAVAFEGEIDGTGYMLDITSEQLASGERFFVFHPRTFETPMVDRRLEPSTGDESEYVKELEQELDDARQTVRTSIEELETSNEELKSSNEEMMSMNEELQSSNEELSTINEELQSKIIELNELNADLGGFVASTSLATIFLDGSLSLRRYTPEANRYFRFVESDIGRPLADIASSLPLSDVVSVCRGALENGATTETDIETLDGAKKLIMRAAGVVASDPSESSLVFTLIDVTQLQTQALALEKAKEEAQLRLAEVDELYRVSPGAMALYDRDLKFIRVNQRLAEINGVPLADHYGKRVDEVLPMLGDAVTKPIREAFATGEPALGQEIIGKTAANPDEDRSWIVDWYPLKKDGDVIAVGVSVRDVTAYKRTEEELRRVMRELQHRVKNMLANVTALINRARRSEGEPETILDTLFDRITALGNTHQLLASENWRSASIRSLIEPELTRVYGDEVIELRGPNLTLSSRAALSMGMALHELATNAAKYGSLSSSEGRLAVSWSTVNEGDGEIFRLVWNESGGPQVSPPETEGYGSALIASTVERSLKGRIKRSWEPGGLRCIFEIPLEAIVEDDDEPTEHMF